MLMFLDFRAEIPQVYATKGGGMLKFINRESSLPRQLNSASHTNNGAYTRTVYTPMK